MTSSFGAKIARRLMVFWGIFAAVTGLLCRELRRHEFMLEVRNNGSTTANFGATGWTLTTSIFSPLWDEGVGERPKWLEVEGLPRVLLFR